MLAAIVAVVMEVAVAIAIAVGFYTRPLAIALAIYTFGTSMIAHHYWNMTGVAQYTNMVNFYKNLSIIAGLLLLSVTGSGQVLAGQEVKPSNPIRNSRRALRRAGSLTDRFAYRSSDTANTQVFDLKILIDTVTWNLRVQGPIA